MEMEEKRLQYQEAERQRQFELEFEPVITSVIPFTRNKHASGAAWGSKSTCQGKEKKKIRAIRLKALLVLGSPVFIVSRRGTLSLTLLCGKPHRLLSLWHLLWDPKRAAREAWSVVGMVTGSWIA